jgi:hypothetical protein
MTNHEHDTAEEIIAETIDGAEEVRDPLDGLVARTRTDPGAPFVPEVLERLAALKKDDRAAFEQLRAQLKTCCRVTALDEALAEETGGAGGLRPTQADILIDLAQTAELFHTDDGTGFADVDIDGHRETWPIRSKVFRRWLARRFFEQTGGAANSDALRSALDVIEAKAHFDAGERTVHVRVGGADGRIYVDLCDKAWRAVEIDATGWRVIDTPPIRFRRAAGMLPLPEPVAGGSIEELRPFLNVRSDKEFILAVAWLLAALRDCGPYPVNALSGEHGTAKSTFATILRNLTDPNTLPLRTPPREDRDLYIAATNGRVVVFDNLSSLADWISDSLCRLSTGGGFATRALYTDLDEVLLRVIRPVILTGIEEVVNRADLADRTIFLTLAPIPKEKRRPETELWAAFARVWPRILGALLDAVAVGLKRLPEIRLETLPRMADFAIWATACETGLRRHDGSFWDAGTFMKAYAGNLDEAVEAVLEASPVATALRTFMAAQTTWTGTATDLLDLLGRVAGEKATKAKTWPVDATRLGGKLRRAATFLREVGIAIHTGERKGRYRTRIITITSLHEPDTGGNAASAASAAKPATTDHSGSDCPVGCANPLKNKGADTTGAEGADFPTPGISLKIQYPNPSNEYIIQLSRDWLHMAAIQLEQTGDVDLPALERWLREKLTAAGVPPEALTVERARVMKAVMAD